MADASSTPPRPKAKREFKSSEFCLTEARARRSDRAPTCYHRSAVPTTSGNGFRTRWSSDTV
eukprot:4055545-Prymnesium_polylepis.1